MKKIFIRTNSSLEKILITSLFQMLLLFILTMNSNAATNFPFNDAVSDSTTTMGNWETNSGTWTLEHVGTTNAHSDSLVWQGFYSSGGWYWLTKKDSMDLTTASSRNPYLSFWMRVSQSGGINYMVQVSTNNGSSWITLQNSTVNNNPSWIRRQYSLYNYRSSEVIVRIGFYLYSANTKLWIDDILIDNAPEPTTLTLSNTTNNGMTLTWGKSQANDFDEYRVLISTTTGNISYSSTTYNHYLAARLENYTITKTNINDTSVTLDRSNYPLAFCNTTYYAKVYELDTQLLYNQGTAQKSLATAWNMNALSVPAIQNFDSTTAPVWAADYPWAISTADSGESGHSSPNTYEDSPGGNYDWYADRYLYSKWYMPATSMKHPVLKFNQKYIINSGDMAYLHYSLNGTNWNELLRYSGTNSNWHPQEFSVPELQNNGSSTPIYIRWRMYANSDGSENDGWHIDDVEISETSHTLTSFPLVENFEDSSNVVDRWVMSNYKREYTTTANSGNYVASSSYQLTGYWRFMTLGTPLDLSGTTNPYISLWNKCSAAGGAYFMVVISSDGGRNWTNIQASTYISHTAWKRYQMSLRAYRTNNVLIRLGYYFVSPIDLWYDDILIDEVPEAHNIYLTNATNNGMTISWDTSTASDFSAYRIILSTATNSLGYTSSTFSHSLSYRSETYAFTETSKTATSMTLNRNNYPLAFAGSNYYAKIYEVDSQGFYNQGSNNATLATASNMDVEEAPFTEDFDSTAVAEWQADIPWTIVTTNADSAGHSHPKCYEDSPDSNYNAYFDRNLISKWTLPASITRPILSFNYINKYSSGDYCELSYSLNGINYTSITKFDGESDAGYGWSKFEFNAGVLRNNAENQPVYLKFRSYSNSSTQNEGFFLDDVTISQNTRPKLTFPFSDNVEDSSTTHNKWSKGEFKRIVTGSAHSGSYVWSSPDKSGGLWYHLTLGSTIDLRSVANPYFSFWMKNAQSGGVYYTVLVSTDGGKNWSSLQNSTYTSNTSWTQYSYSLYNYRSEFTQVSVGYYRSSVIDYYLDDFLITNSPTLISPENGATNVPLWTDFSWTESNTSSEYQIQVSLNSGFTNLVIDDTLSTTEYTNTTSFSTATQHWWRVRGINAETGWATAYDFTTSANTIEPPKLISPTDGAADISTSHTFTWSKVDSATSYRIQVTIDRGFTSTTIDTVLTDTTYYSDAELQSGTTYYWRGRSHKTTDTSIYSSSDIFAVASGECGATTKNLEATIKLYGFWDGSKQSIVPITLELRTGSTLMNSTLVERKAGIIDTTGKVIINFCRQNDGNYWLVARSTGFLPLGSTSQISLSTTTATYDFTSASTKAAGGSRAMYDDNGTWLMRSGELTGDRRISASDNSKFIENAGRSLVNDVPAQ